MDRRISGALMIVLALVSVLILPRALHPAVVAGSAAPVPPGPPPSVGDCVSDTNWSTGYDSSGALVQTRPATFVPCTEPHLGEVIHVNPDFQPAPYNAGQPYGGFDDPCTNPARSDLTYLGLDPDTTNLWEPALATGTRVMGPDARQFAAGQRWAACVTSFFGPTALTTTLRDTGRRNDLPPTLAVCFTGPETAPLERSARCDAPHTAELLAAMTLTAGDPIGQQALDLRCAELAAAQAGRDLAAEPHLRLAALTYAYAAATAPTAVVAPLPADADGGWSSCTVLTADGHRLTASVRGLGTDPVPWAS